MTDKMDLEENGSSESALREAAEVELSKSPDASTKLKKRSPEESSTNCRFIRLNWRCRMTN